IFTRHTYKLATPPYGQICYATGQRQFRHLMINYTLLNKAKLIRTFVWTAIILTIAFCIWAYYNCDSVNCYNSSDFIFGLITTLFILPTISIMLETTQGYIEYRRTEKFFNSIPMSELFKNGFKASL